MRYLILLILALPVHAQEFGNEVYYSNSICANTHIIGGNPKSKIELPDEKTRVYPDCETDTHVFEFDWAVRKKMYECAGQAMFYAALTDKYPVCFLLIRTDKEEAFAKAQSEYFRKMNIGYLYLRVQPKTP